MKRLSPSTAMMISDAWAGGLILFYLSGKPTLLGDLVCIIICAGLLVMSVAIWKDDENL